MEGKCQSFLDNFLAQFGGVRAWDCSLSRHHGRAQHNYEFATHTYVGRVLRLALLAPDIVEAILGGRQPAGRQLENYCDGFQRDGRNRNRHFRDSLRAV